MSHQAPNHVEKETASHRKSARRPVKAANPTPGASLNRTASGMLGLQRIIGNAAAIRVARPMVLQRISFGAPPTPTPKKEWEVMGGFASKHIISGALSPATARAKWAERFKKDPKGWHNTVVSEDDLKASIKAGEVKGTYPQPRVGQRLPMVVEVPAMKVTGRNQDGAKVPGKVTNLTQVGVTGSATEGIYFPDHLEGSLST